MICPLGKQSKLSFPLSNHVVEDVFDLVHGDTWGLFNEETV